MSAPDTPRRGALFVEGHGENDAAPLLLNRLWSHLRLDPVVNWERPIYRGNNLKNPQVLSRLVSGRWPELRRYGAFMVLYDADFRIGGRDACPKFDGPAAARILREARLPLPAAVVLPWKEFEHWIAACLPRMAGQPVVDFRTHVPLARVVNDTGRVLDRMSSRNGKAIVRDHLDPPIYHETTHQAALTAMIDFDHLMQDAVDELVPAFGTLCRACREIARHIKSPGFVYPSFRG
jgi:hypothetical protein